MTIFQHANIRLTPIHLSSRTHSRRDLCFLFARLLIFFFCKQKTAYDISECDWSSDVCSSDLKQKTAYEISELQSHSEISYAVFCLKSEENKSEIQSHSQISINAITMKQK